MKVLLFTDVEKKDPDKDLQNELDEDSRSKYKKYLTKMYPNHRRFWAGTLNVAQGSAQFFNAVKDWKSLYEVCNTDENFRNREETAPGYLTAILVLAYEAKPAVLGEGPATTAKRSEDKASIK